MIVCTYEIRNNDNKSQHFIVVAVIVLEFVFVCKVNCRHLTGLRLKQIFESMCDC